MRLFDAWRITILFHSFSAWHKFVLLFLSAGWMAACASFSWFFFFIIFTATTDHRTSRPKRVVLVVVICFARIRRGESAGWGVHDSKNLCIIKEIC